MEENDKAVPTDISKHVVKPEESNAENLAKHTVKDTVFRDLFGNPKYLMRLYQSLHPEDTETTIDDISNVTIKHILLNQMYNDLGFTVGSKLLVLLEAQSTWSLNIAIRAYMYLAKTWQECIEKKHMNPYGSTVISLPKPELYMIYTGNRKHCQEVISLSEDIFGEASEYLELKVKVIYNSDKENIISEYIKFTKVYNEQVKKYGRSRKAVLETIRICRDAGILAEYLQEREREVVNIMMSLFDQEYATKCWGEELKAEGEAIGRQQGEINGKKSMARSLAKMGVSIKKIAQGANVSEEQVRQWLQESGPSMA